MILEVLGIDIGGTGIKGAVVNIDTGELLTERHKILTPTGAKPNDVREVANELVDKFNWNTKKIGIGFPAIIKDKICLSACNIDKSWLGLNVIDHFSILTSDTINVINDADAAGMAERRFNMEIDWSGTVILFTLGTGIGSALFYNGVLVPNTELGQLELNGAIAEHNASNKARKTKELDWDQYSKELNIFFEYIDSIFNPHRLIIGGGLSKKLEKYKHHLNPNIKVFRASMDNVAGVVGAALAY